MEIGGGNAITSTPPPISILTISNHTTWISRLIYSSLDARLDLKLQGSQDIVNKSIDHQNDFNPTVLIPANAELLQELGDR